MFYRDGRYPEALAFARQALDRLPRFGNRGVRDRVVHLAADTALVHRLEEIRMELTAVLLDGSEYDKITASSSYRDAFLDYGVDVLGGDEGQVTEVLRRSSAKAEIVAALIHWKILTDGSGDKEKLRRLVLDLGLELDGVGVPVLKAVLARDADSIRRLAHVLNGDSHTPLFLTILADYLVSFEAKEDAVRLLTEGLRIHPENLWLNNTLGTTYLTMDASLRSEALRYSTVVLSIRPLSSTPHVNLGVALKELERWDEAEAEYRRAIALKPDYAMAHNNLGVLLKDRGKWDEAEAEYRRAIALKPSYAKPRNNLSDLLKDRGKWDEAEAEYRRAIATIPNNATALNNLGVLLHDRGKSDEAEAEYRRANLGSVLRAQGKLEAAITEYREAIRYRKDSPVFHSNLGVVLAEKFRFEEAIAEFSKAIALKPDLAEAHNYLGNALRQYGKPVESEAALRKAIALKPDYAGAHYNLGIALKEKGRLDEAITEYREANRINKDMPEAHFYLGIAFKANGRLDEAIAEYRETIRLKKDHAESHCNIGRILVMKGQFAEALVYLRRGHELGSKDPRWPHPSAQWVRQAEQLIELDAKLPQVLRGETKPANAVNCIEFAIMCGQYKTLYVASARFYAAAFAIQPALADDLNNQHRYNAACAAALAGCGQGKDAAELPAEESARLRKQALDWLALI